MPGGGGGGLEYVTKSELGGQSGKPEEESLELSLGFRAPEKEQARLWEHQGQRPNGRKESGNLEPEVGACNRG